MNHFPSYFLICILWPGMVFCQKSMNGVYAFEDGTYLCISSLDGNPVITFSDGNVRGLRPSNAGKGFEFGDAIGQFNRVEGIVVKRSRNSLELRRIGESAKIGTRRVFKEKPVQLKNGEVELSGTLILPPGEGPFPCVILTHGSGPERRESSQGLSYLFAGNGIAAFIYDKRFVGDKDENRWQDSFENYAGDAIAAATKLASSPHVMPGKIGIFGHSQGGWVAPLAASKSTLFSFLIISAGNVVSPVEQHLYNGSCRLRQGGVKERAIKEIYDFRWIKYEAGISGNLDKYNAALPIAKEKIWFERTGDGVPIAVFWKENGFYDTRPALRKVKCPVLVMAGELDKYSDTQRNMQLFKEVFAESGNQDVTYRIFPSANHAYLETPTGMLDETEMATLRKFADGYLDLLFSWVKERTAAR